MNVEEKEKALETALLEIKKQFGEGAVTTLTNGNISDVEAISTGSLSLDIATGIGGVPKGRIIEVYGPESCICEDVFIPYELRNIDTNKRINHKGGTIKNLYERFYDISTDKRKRKINRQDVVFYVSSINEEDAIIKQPIADVVKCGKKECYEVMVESGKTITTTKDHKFYIGNGEYKTLEKINVGDYVFLHDNTPFSKEKQRKHYPEVCVKNHNNKGKKIVKATNRTKTLNYEYEYYRVKKSQLVIEATLNGLSYDEYLYALNNWNKEELKNFYYIDSNKLDVHHIDGNPHNNRITNLQILPKNNHYKKHAKSKLKHLSYKAHSEKITSISYVGEKETYDIKCFAPFNNYIANNFVVHNCGKTTLTLHIIAEAQKGGGKAAFIDAEHALDPVYAKNIGVNINELLVSQPDSGEQALEITEALVRSNALDVIVIDSVAALVPKSEIEGNMGDTHVGLQARLMSQALRKLTGIVSKSNCAVIFINQIREKVGVMYGNPEVTTGGRALKFYSSMRIDIRRIEQIKQGTEVLGNKTRAKIVKNKVAPPFRQAEFDIVYGEGISKEADLIECAINNGIIDKAGSWFSYKDEKIGQGREKVKQYLKDNPDIAKEIEDSVYEIVNMVVDEDGVIIEN